MIWFPSGNIEHVEQQHSDMEEVQSNIERVATLRMKYQAVNRVVRIIKTQ